MSEQKNDNTIEFPTGTESLTAKGRQKSTGDDAPQKVLLLGLDTGATDAERSMAELAALAGANHMEPVTEVLQKRDAGAGRSATVLGSGRLAEAKLLASNLEAELAVFDGELTGSQLRNMDEALGIPVLDRTMLILEIFRRRAVSREGKTQTELATLEYRLPRLAGLGGGLSRQGGGGGGGGGARRGGGETQLEYDRRYIRERISTLKKRLAAMQARREETRRTRDKSNMPLIALVGYTNVGKSSLANALTGSEIGVADMLFATLDATARQLALPDGQRAILTDTVGFVSRLPHGLVEAFKSTLDEARYADLLIEVCDAADSEAEEQLAVTEEVLSSLGAEAPRIVVYNKVDKVPGFVPPSPEALAVSAATGAGLPELLARMAAALADRMRQLTVLLPYDKLPLADLMRRQGLVEKEEFREDGVLLRGRMPAIRTAPFAPYLWAGQDEAPPEGMETGVLPSSPGAAEETGKKKNGEV